MGRGALRALRPYPTRNTAMGSYDLRDTTYRAAVLGDGELLIFTYKLGHDTNTHPHTDRWSLSHVGDLQSILQDVGLTCACIEDGITQFGAGQDNAMAALGYAKTQLAALAEPVPLIELAQSARIAPPTPCSGWLRVVRSRIAMQCRQPSIRRCSAGAFVLATSWILWTTRACCWSWTTSRDPATTLGRASLDQSATIRQRSCTRMSSRSP